MKQVQDLRRIEPSMIILVLFAACFLVYATYLLMPEPSIFTYSPFGSWLSPVHATPALRVLNLSYLRSGDEESSNEISPISVGSKSSDCDMVGSIKTQEVYKTSDASAQGEEAGKPVISDGQENDMKPDHIKPMCDLSDPRYSLCKMDGDIRIHGKSSSISVVAPQLPERTESLSIRIYPRKADPTAMGNSRELFVSSSSASLPCTANHSYPALVLSTGGYTGNFFHDFTDVLIPLFLTSHQYNGEVQFLVTSYHSWWIDKYHPIFNQLTRYKIIDFDNDDTVHCYPHTVVGLRSHKELSIDPSRSPDGCSMLDFARFMRAAYKLDRISPLRMRENSGTKPRLLIIARSQTRMFTNIGDIIALAEQLGFEVVIGKPEFTTELTQFAPIVNSCDVMVGVHGAGLTHLVFLPTNAVVIQVVPWGGLDWIANIDFGVPAMDMRLRYVEYSISEEESTLGEMYSRDDPVFKDPMSIHKMGWDEMGKIYLVKQNVKLDVIRFKGVLVQALEHLKQF